MRYLPTANFAKRITGFDKLPLEGESPVYVNGVGELTAGTNFDNTHVFVNADSVIIDYTDEGRRPVISVFVKDAFDQYHEAFPTIEYSEQNRTARITFGYNVFESGYVVVN